ncbi:methylamine utilization protein MauG [Sphingomonas gilva]|uniref:Methylamine utilization protein MauG n=2 Tax=Sphingomonas gilva TaxID=2305907 RepID=A0A396RQK6_9SPHN|nr:methylamine utilization protein MauG [Sphingomonas gilva]
MSDHDLAGDGMRLAVLREAALKNGFVPAESLEIPGDPARQAVGGLIFASPLMSLNGKISCQDCHLDQFGSADGLPNAIGVGGTGHGVARMRSGGGILPRNVLPFWGRGSKGFDTFFWDSRVRLVDGRVISQFGDRAPSNDPMIVAVHLPSVEVREMIADNPQVRDGLVDESVDIAAQIHQTIARRFGADATIGQQLARTYGVRRDAMEFAQISDALAQFIRHRFRIQPTRLHRFVFDRGPISRTELNGGILFYGRGRCAACHNGPYFSDFESHAVAFPQVGFGKNGFGTDEGRFNVTLNPDDRFLFRTPPLYNVTKTSPYSHSGSIVRIEDAIVSHFDPLRLVDTKKMSARARADLYQRLGVAARETLPAQLTDQEVRELVAFLRMLDFDPNASVPSTGAMLQRAR